MYKKKIFNDKIRRSNFYTRELRVVVLKSLLDPFVATAVTRDICNRITCFNKNFSATTIRNTCVLTGRRNGVHRYFRLSRIALRDSSAKNDSYGLQKSS